MLLHNVCPLIYHPLYCAIIYHNDPYHPQFGTYTQARMWALRLVHNVMQGLALR